MKYSAKIPFDYSLTENLVEVAKQNLINLFLTDPNERVMKELGEYGIGIKDLNFEYSDELFQIKQERIYQQVNTYLSYIHINSINEFKKENRLQYLEVDFSVDSLRFQGIVRINVYKY